MGRTSRSNKYNAPRVRNDKYQTGVAQFRHAIAAMLRLTERFCAKKFLRQRTIFAVQCIGPTCIRALRGIAALLSVPPSVRLSVCNVGDLW